MRETFQDLLERLRPTLGRRRVEALWLHYLAADRNEKQQLEGTIGVLDARRNATGPGRGPPALPPPEPGLLAGWLRLGDVTYPGLPPTPFGLEKGELIQHVGIFGRSGAGKTNTVLALLRGLLDRQVPFLIFDWKRNYRDLLAAPWVPPGRVAAFTAGRDLAPLRLNPLRPPPGTDPRTWLKKLIEIIAHAYFLGEGVMYLLQEAIDTCYREAGVYDGGDHYPTFRDVHAHLRQRKVVGREANWMASTLRTTASLTFGSMEELVCSDEPMNLDQLLRQPVVLELDALPDADKIFVVEALLLAIHHYRLAHGERETLQHVLVIEEAHHVFLRSKQELGGGEPITDVLLREIRELGEAVVLIDQHPSQIAITALGNTFCTIAMNLKHRADVNTIADACLLTLGEREHLGRLPVGEAIVKLQDRWPAPFQVRFPLIRLEKGRVRDEDLRRRLGLDPAERTPTVPPKKIPPAQVKPEPIPAIPPPPKKNPGEAARRFLEHTADQPGVGVTQRYSALGLSRRRGTQLKRKLVEEGFLREVPVPLPGGRVTLLELSDAGWAAVGRSPPPARHGGVVHRFWMERLAEAFRKRGYRTETEVSMGCGRALDLVASKEDATVALEVEISGRRLEASLAKLAESHADRRILARGKAIVERAQALLATRSDRTEIEIVHLWSLLPRPAGRHQSQQAKG